MNPIVKNGLALLLGLVLGGALNMAIITIGPSIIPLPEGVDPNNIESIQKNIQNYSIGNLITPILAHALGTLFGAYITAKIAVTKKFSLAMAVGVFFMIGGIMMINMLPNAPLWMKVTDLFLAYIPMGWMGWKIAGSK